MFGPRNSRLVANLRPEPEAGNYRFSAAGALPIEIKLLWLHKVKAYTHTQRGSIFCCICVISFFTTRNCESAVVGKCIGSGIMIVVLFFLCLTLLSPALAAAKDVRTYDILPSISDVRKLKVGQELFAEQLALKSGRRIYVLEGLELPKSYEVKISYPASIPAKFTIELLKDGSFQASRGGRRLLNTEKLMFRADESQDAVVYGSMPSAHVLVTVEPAGVVAMPHTQDHAFAVFNILCEEVKFGIPRQAWWIGLLGAVAVLISVVSPMLIPRHLLPRKDKEPHRKSTSYGRMQIENELNPVHGM